MAKLKRSNVLGILLMGIIGIFILTGLQVYKLLTLPLVTGTSVRLLVKEGMTLSQIAEHVSDKTQLEYPTFLVLLAKLKDSGETLQAGEYLITTHTTLPKLIDKMKHGDVILHSVTIASGQRFSEVKSKLNNTPYIKHLMPHLNSSQIMAKIGAPGKNPEGRIYPNTYLYGAQISDLTILAKTYRQMQKVLNNEWSKRASGLPYQCKYKALTAASLINKETHVSSERSRIAGVIVRRLKKNMRLQMDPTVIYALGKKFEYPVTYEDIKIDSPYNTYRYKGLPPTPIANPTRADIHAALHPDKGDSLYFVAKDDGTHVFTSTLEAHKKAKKRIRAN